MTQGSPPGPGSATNGFQWDGVQWVRAPAPPEAVLGELHKLAEGWQLGLSQSGHTVTLERLVAEQKGVLSRTRLEYFAKVAVDGAQGEVRFSEMLKETGRGLSTGGGDFDGDVGVGFGFQAGTYRSGTQVADTIEEQERRLGPRFGTSFPHAALRDQVAGIAGAFGYRFTLSRW